MRGLVMRDEAGITEEQVLLLNKIHKLGREMENINNTGKAHAIIALIEELSKEPIALSYITEKVERLFDCKITIER